MNTTTLSTARESAAFSLPASASAASRAVLKLLERIRHGSLTLQLPDGSMQRFGQQTLPHATLVLHNWQPCSAALKSGDIGFAESLSLIHIEMCIRDSSHAVPGPPGTTSAQPAPAQAPTRHGFACIT